MTDSIEKIPVGITGAITNHRPWEHEEESGPLRRIEEDLGNIRVRVGETEDLVRVIRYSVGDGNEAMERRDFLYKKLDKIADRLDELRFPLWALVALAAYFVFRH